MNFLKNTFFCCSNGVPKEEGEAYVHEVICHDQTQNQIKGVENLGNSYCSFESMEYLNFLDKDSLIISPKTEKRKDKKPRANVSPRRRSLHKLPKKTDPTPKMQPIFEEEKESESHPFLSNMGSSFSKLERKRQEVEASQEAIRERRAIYPHHGIIEEFQEIASEKKGENERDEKTPSKTIGRSLTLPGQQKNAYIPIIEPQFTAKFEKDQDPAARTSKTI
jgi:hypothetical protein